MNHLSSNIILKWDHHHLLEYSLEGGEKNGIPPSTMFLVQMVPFGYGAIVGRWRESMKTGDLVRINRFHMDFNMGTLFGILLSIHPLEPINTSYGISYTIRLLEIGGRISDFIIDPEDEREIICEGG